MTDIILVTGGARSGKSRYAQERIRQLPRPWTYLATAEARDEEMAERIRQHQDERRGSDAWVTVEEPLALVERLKDNEAAGAQLVDCLTLWLSNLLEAERSPATETERLCHFLETTSTPVVLVTNEVGMGIVPANAQTRKFRDEAGRLNQAIASLASETIFMVCGLAMTMSPAHLPPPRSERSS